MCLAENRTPSLPTQLTPRVPAVERCIGVCGASDSSSLLHDFATTVALAELSDEVLGEGGAEAAHGNCTKKTATVLVDFFEGGDSFKTFAARIRVRSAQLQFNPLRSAGSLCIARTNACGGVAPPHAIGMTDVICSSCIVVGLCQTCSPPQTGGMTALDVEWCNNNPISCGTVQRVLERTPGLVWANGQFRHAFDLESPAPPPPPNPPPVRLFLPTFSQAANRP